MSTSTLPKSDTRARNRAQHQLVTLGPLAAGILASGIALYALSRPGALHDVVEYDDGVYFGAAVKLIAGQLPYRDFTFLQPPGIAVLFAPVALATHFAGTRAGLAAARVLTALVVGLNAWLAGRLLRHRGPLAATSAALFLAVFPAAFFADRTLLLEPYLVGLCLVAVNVCFVGDKVAARRRLVLGGLLLGAAAATKLWAVVVIAALCLALLSGDPASRSDEGAGRVRGRLIPLLGGAALGFSLICLPFFVVAPRAFVHDVVVTQLQRANGPGPTSSSRLAAIVGLVGIDGVGSGGWLLLVVGLLLLTVLVAFCLRPSLSGHGGPLQRFVLLATAGSVGALLLPSEFFDHYAYFAAPFLALALALALSDVLRALTKRLRTVGRGRLLDSAAVGVAVAALVIAGLAFVTVGEARYDTATLASSGDPSLAIDLAVPPHSCALSDAAILLLEANRLSNGAHCPDLLDADALWLATAPRESPEACAPIDPTLVGDWRGFFAVADFFVESGSAYARVPWTVALRSWFAAHYRLLADPGARIYVRLNSVYAGAALDPANWTPARLATEGFVRRPRTAASLPAPKLPACLTTRR